jgi:type II secretory pathway component PulC
LVDIIGAGKQLQATVEDTGSGQRKKLSVGKTLDGYTIKSISLDDGVVFLKDGRTETLNIGKEK